MTPGANERIRRSCRMRHAPEAQELRSREHPHGPAVTVTHTERAPAKTVCPFESTTGDGARYRSPQKRRPSAAHGSRPLRRRRHGAGRSLRPLTCP